MVISSRVQRVRRKRCSQRSASAGRGGVNANLALAGSEGGGGERGGRRPAGGVRSGRVCSFPRVSRGPREKGVPTAPARGAGGGLSPRRPGGKEGGGGGRGGGQWGGGRQGGGRDGSGPG